MRAEVFVNLTKAKKDTEEGRSLREIMNNGKIVPSEITCGLLKKSMDLTEGGKVNSCIISEKCIHYRWIPKKFGEFYCLE